MKAITAACALAASIVAAVPARSAPSTVIVPGARAFPESVTSTQDGTLYVGSVGEGGILKAAPGAAAAEPWIKPGTSGTRSIFGVLADERTGTLWACSNDVSAMGIPSPGDAKGSALKGFDLAPWNALMAPRGTPRQIVDYLNSHVVAILAEPETRDKMLKLGIQPMSGTPDELGEFVKAEGRKWGDLVRQAKIVAQ